MIIQNKKIKVFKKSTQNFDNNNNNESIIKLDDNKSNKTSIIEILSSDSSKNYIKKNDRTKIKKKLQ